LQAEVTRAREIAAATAAAVVWGSATLCIKYAEDRAALAEREARERESRVEVENVVSLASAHEDAEGLLRKIALLEGELAEERRAWELVEENSCGLPDVAADAERRWELSEREHREQFEELTLLQTQGFELCHAIVSPPQVRNHLSEKMRLAALRHTEMARELTMLRAVVSSAVESVLGHSLDKIFHVEVVGELVAEFQRLEERHSRLERPTMRICDLLLGPLPSRAQLANHLDEAAG
jgi:hypothetical protein